MVDDQRGSFGSRSQGRRRFAGARLGRAVPPVAIAALLVISGGGTAAAQHHDLDSDGPAAIDGVWLRVAILTALVVVTGLALLRPFGLGIGPREQVAAVVAAAVAVVGELALVPSEVDRLDPQTAGLPVMFVMGALALLPVLAWSRRGGVAMLLPACVGVLALVLGTDVRAAGDVLAGSLSPDVLRSSALVWIAALAWFALCTPKTRLASRVLCCAAFWTAVIVIAVSPGFVAAGEHAAAS